MSRKDKSSDMCRTRSAILGLLFVTAFAGGFPAVGGNLLVESSGKLLLIGIDGTQRVLADSVIFAALSPDGHSLAFTHDENPQASSNSSQILSVMPTGGGVPKRIAQLSPGAHFESLGWMRDGSAVVYQGREGHLFLATLSASGTTPRDLGPWYQDFSASPDGSRIVHAVNAPVM